MDILSSKLGILKNIPDVSLWTYNDEFLFIVSNKNDLIQVSLTNIELRKLNKTKAKPTAIHCDELYLYLGYNDGGIEIRDPATINEIKNVDISDLRGPGRKKITEISSNHNFTFTNSEENGVIIFRKPSILSYKWILIDGNTEFTSFSFHGYQIFVLTKLGEIYTLDFNIQKLIEVDSNILSLAYNDLEFDGKFLYLLRKNLMKIYFIESYELKKTLKLDSDIIRIFHFQGFIGLLTSEGKLLVLDKDFNIIETQIIIDLGLGTQNLWKYKSQSRVSIKYIGLTKNLDVVQYSIQK